MRPIELPMLRRSVVNFLDTDRAKACWTQMVKNGQWFGAHVGDSTPNGEAARTIGGAPGAAERLRAFEAQTWRYGELFHVSGQMTKVAIEASKSLPPDAWRVLSSDLPAETGVMYFDEPIHVGERVNLPAQAITVVSWHPIVDEAGTRFVWVSFWTDLQFGIEVALREGHYTRDQANLELAANAPVVYDNEALLKITHVWDAEIPEGNGGYLLSVVRAAWLLMQQPIASVRPLTLRAHESRKAQRRHIDLTAVRVVTLRHEVRPTTGGDGHARSHNHRWLVRGHWRRQWYPSRNGHVPIWIHAHIKGPDDAPLATGETVSAWSR